MLNKTKLDNGLLVTTDQVQDFHSAVAILVVKTGSINESESNNGISHFMEHMAFKGTKKRTALQISNEIEFIGGSMNAYTSKEVTAYHIKLLNKDINTAIDIIADIVQNSTLPENEIEIERGSILQEISLSLDDPSDVAFENFYSKAYESSSLGMGILGPRSNIEKFKKEDFTSYLDDRYFSENMIFSVCGNVSHEDIIKSTSGFFNNLQSKSSYDKSPISQTYTGGNIIKSNADIEQTQFVLGFKAFSYDESEIDDYYASQILSDILGDGMSSRLFQEVREKRGLAYGISCFNDCYLNTGMMIINADVSAEKVSELVKILKHELHQATETIKEDELQRTVNQYRASLLMSSESTGFRASRMAKNLLLKGRYITDEEIINMVESMTIEKVQNVMKKILSGAKEHEPTISIYGNISNKIKDNELDILS